MARGKSSRKIKRQKVTFSLEAVDAEAVVLMGDFNDWNPKKHPMQRDENGVWLKNLLLLPGKYEYKFMVDGRWQGDPQNEQICANRYGTYNNVVNLIPKAK